MRTRPSFRDRGQHTHMLGERNAFQSELHARLSPWCNIKIPGMRHYSSSSWSALSSLQKLCPEPPQINEHNPTYVSMRAALRNYSCCFLTSPCANERPSRTAPPSRPPYIAQATGRPALTQTNRDRTHKYELSRIFVFPNTQPTPASNWLWTTLRPNPQHSWNSAPRASPNPTFLLSRLRIILLDC